jgi:hypothetical protein
MDLNHILLYLVLTVIFLAPAYALYKIITAVNVIKKYRAEVQRKNEAWLKERNLTNTSNLAIMNHFFGLTETNLFKITKIDRNLEGHEIIVNFLVKDQDVTLALDMESIVIVTDDSNAPTIKFTFDPKYLGDTYDQIWDTWGETAAYTTADDFLYLANITIYMSQGLIEKILEPIYTAQK